MVRLWLWLILSLALFGCGSNQRDLAFSTIEKEDWGSRTGIYYELSSPKMAIVATQADIENLNGLINEEAMAELNTLNFDERFALVVFHGVTGMLGYGVTVTRVVEADEQINVYAEFVDPCRNRSECGGEAAMSSPYHVIAVDKTVQGYTQFNLIVDRQTVFSESWNVP